MYFVSMSDETLIFHYLLFPSPENVAKKKWGNLRDYFQRQHRDVLTAKSGSAPSKKKKWALYDSMSFLIPYLSDRNTFGNLDDASGTAVSSKCGDTQDTIPMTFSPASQLPREHSPGPSVSTENSERVSSSQLSMKRKLPKRSIDIEILETLKAMPAASTDKHEEEDEDYMFFKNLVPKMKCLNDIQKLELQAEINSVFIKHLKIAQMPAPPRQQSPIFSRGYTYPTEQEEYFQYEQS